MPSPLQIAVLHGRESQSPAVTHATQTPLLLQTSSFGSQVGHGHCPLLQHSRQTPLPLSTQQCSSPGQPSALSPSQQRALAMQSVPHGLKPLSHWHRPPSHEALAGQGIPHPPQFWLSVRVCLQLPSQQSCPCASQPGA